MRWAIGLDDLDRDRFPHAVCHAGIQFRNRLASFGEARGKKWEDSMSPCIFRSITTCGGAYIVLARALSGSKPLLQQRAIMNKQKVLPSLRSSIPKEKC